MGYSKGVISIPSVTGDVTIYITADRPLACTNVARTGIDTSGALYNGVGYKDNIMLATDGADQTYVGWTATGYIPVASGSHTFRFGGSAYSDYTEYGWRLQVYDESFTLVRNINGSLWNNGGDYNPTIIADDATSTVCISVPADLISSSVKYIRFSVKTGSSGGTPPADGANLIISMDESIY